jgi:hypothetical protein
MLVHSMNMKMCKGNDNGTSKPGAMIMTVHKKSGHTIPHSRTLLCSEDAHRPRMGLESTPHPAADNALQNSLISH